MSVERFHSPVVDSCSVADSRCQRWDMCLGHCWSQTGWTGESSLSASEAPVGLLVSGNSMSATACWEIVESERRLVAWKVGTTVAASQSQRLAMDALSEQ